PQSLNGENLSHSVPVSVQSNVLTNRADHQPGIKLYPARLTRGFVFRTQSETDRFKTFSSRSFTILLKCKWHNMSGQREVCARDARRAEFAAQFRPPRIRTFGQYRR